MPHPEVEKLDKNSSRAQMKAAKSSCIATEVRGGREQDQSVAMCNSMVKEKTGVDLSKE